jgi:hypothetical protein
MGSFSLLGSVVPRDAGVAAKLRAYRPMTDGLRYILQCGYLMSRRLSLGKPRSLNGPTSVETYPRASLVVVSKHLTPFWLKLIPRGLDLEVESQPILELGPVKFMLLRV